MCRLCVSKLKEKRANWIINDAVIGYRGVIVEHCIRLDNDRCDRGDRDKHRPGWGAIAVRDVSNAADWSDGDNRIAAPGGTPLPNTQCHVLRNRTLDVRAAYHLRRL